VTGNAVDFVEFPSDVAPEMITDLLPHCGRDQTLKGQYINGAKYYWCLYRRSASDHVASGAIEL